jgi:flagellar biosynthetic protein FlhB
MPQEPRSQRTERPTAKRLKKAREQGQVPRSREVPGAMVLAGFLLFAHVLGPGWLDRLEAMLVTFLGSAATIERFDANLIALFNSATAATGMLLAAPLGVLALAGVAGNLIQGGPAFTTHPLKPRFDKLNPIQGLKRVLSLRQWVEVLKSVLKMALYGAVAYTAARDVVLYEPVGSPGPEGTFQMLAGLTGAVLARGTVLAAVLALLDYLFRRYDHTRQLRMTKRQVKDEYKETEGDPMIRARIRQKQMALARSRMMADVPRATVVVTNPDHFAVALRYVPGETDAPQLLAKGRARLAEKIREIAREHRIPIVSDPPLARALYRSVAVGAQIPPGFFRAVAEVLALVLSRRRAAPLPHLTGEETRR